MLPSYHCCILFKYENEMFLLKLKGKTKSFIVFFDNSVFILFAIEIFDSY